MDFGGLLGNETLKRRLSASFSQGRALHSYLITGPEGSGKHTLAVWLSAALTCAAPNAPCMRCSSCRKAMAGTHPDIITVDSERATIPVDTIRQACADAWLTPTEGVRRVFLIPRAGDMNAQGQNALLKTIEEPPERCAFILLCKNDAVLLPTVRSRCARLALSPLPQSVVQSELAKRFPEASAQERQEAWERSGGYLGQAIAAMEYQEPTQAQTLAKAFASTSALAAMEAAYALQGLKTDAFSQILDAFSQILSDSLLTAAAERPATGFAKTIAASRSRRDIMALYSGVEQLKLWCAANVNPNHLAGELALLLYQPGAWPPATD